LLATDFRSFVDAVRNAGDIVRLVGDYVHLKPGGSRLKGLCPFHQEKTPSFSVDPKNQLFYCFGCQTGGDVFKFVQLYEKVDFKEAVEFLANRWGVPLPARTQAASASDRLHQLNEAAQKFFRSRFTDEEAGRRAREYASSRGLEQETLDRLAVGYAPAGWEELRAYLLGQRFKADELTAGGLTIPRKDGRGEYDRFRDRLMFPIRDVQGRTIAFGGRCLDGSDPKYINSPETPVYVKGAHLYGLDQAREPIRKAGFAVLVEGYLDLAAVVQAGVTNAVASLGTAFTPEQAKLLARYTDRVVVCYDGDAAGQNATARSLDLLLTSNFQVHVADLPGGVDPDDFLRSDGAPAFEGILRDAPSYLDFLIQRQARSRDLSRTEEKVAAVNALLPRIARMASAVERASWAGRIADALRIEEDLVLHELRVALKGRHDRIRHRAPADEKLRLAEAQLVASLIQGGEEAPDEAVDIHDDDLAGTRVATIVHAIRALRERGEPADFPSVFQALDSEDERGLLARIALHEEEGPQVPKRLGECLKVLRKERLVRERGKLLKEIESSASDPALLDALLIRKLEIGRLIDSL